MVSINCKRLLFFSPSQKENNMPLFKYHKGLDGLFPGEVPEVQKHALNSSKGPYLATVNGLRGYNPSWARGPLTKLHGTCPLEEPISFLPPIILKGKSVPAHISERGTRWRPQPPNSQSLS